jgi:hypothetical protein
MVLLVCGIAVSFFLFGKPLWPERHARMVIIVPVDMKTTSAINRLQPNLPPNFDVSIAPPRPVPQ